MRAQIDAEARLQGGKVQLEITQQAFADCAQQLLIRVATQTAEQRQLTDGQLLLVVLHVTDVLHMQLADLAVGGQAQAEMITGVTAEALAVVVQLAVFLGDGEVIVGQGELAQTDIAVAGRQQLLYRMAAHDPLVRLGGKTAGHQALQGAVAARWMGIVEDPHTAGLQLDDGRHLAGKAAGGLPGPAIAEVDVHRTKIQGPCGIDQRARLPRALEIHLGLAIGRVDVRHTDIDVIEAQLTQQAHGRPGAVGQIDVDAVVATRIGLEVAAPLQMLHQAIELDGSGQAAGEMQLLDPLGRTEVATEHVDLTGQMLQVHAKVAGHRQLHSDRQRALRQATAAQRTQQVQGGDAALKLGVLRVAATRQRGVSVALDQLAVPFNGCTHVAILAGLHVAVSGHGEKNLLITINSNACRRLTSGPDAAPAYAGCSGRGRAGGPRWPSCPRTAPGP